MTVILALQWLDADMDTIAPWSGWSIEIGRAHV